MLSKKEKLLSFELIVIYIVGIVGITLPLHPDFVRLTPLNLLVSAGLMLWNHDDFSVRNIIGLCLTFLIGFLAEAHGSNYGIIFGAYRYGDVMGWQLWNTPLSAGLLWLIVTYGVVAGLNLLFPTWNIFVKTIIGAVLLVCLDFLIEPIAIKLIFWQWANVVVPLQNYIGWFFISLIQLTVFQLFIKENKNKIGLILFLIQFIFFGILNLLL